MKTSFAWLVFIHIIFVFCARVLKKWKLKPHRSWVLIFMSWWNKCLRQLSVLVECRKKGGKNSLGLKESIWGIFIFDHIRKKISRNSLISVSLDNIAVLVTMVEIYCGGMCHRYKTVFYFSLSFKKNVSLSHLLRDKGIKIKCLSF